MKWRSRNVAAFPGPVLRGIEPDFLSIYSIGPHLHLIANIFIFILRSLSCSLNGRCLDNCDWTRRIEVHYQFTTLQRRSVQLSFMYVVLFIDAKHLVDFPPDQWHRLCFEDQYVAMVFQMREVSLFPAGLKLDPELRMVEVILSSASGKSSPSSPLFAFLTRTQCANLKAHIWSSVAHSISENVDRYKCGASASGRPCARSEMRRPMVCTELDSSSQREGSLSDASQSMIDRMH
jgi:hypothetical protein